MQGFFFTPMDLTIGIWGHSTFTVPLIQLIIEHFLLNQQTFLIHHGIYLHYQKRCVLKYVLPLQGNQPMHQSLLQSTLSLCQYRKGRTCASITANTLIHTLVKSCTTQTKNKIKICCTTTEVWTGSPHISVTTASEWWIISILRSWADGILCIASCSRVWKTLGAKEASPLRCSSCVNKVLGQINNSTAEAMGQEAQVTTEKYCVFSGKKWSSSLQLFDYIDGKKIFFIQITFRYLHAIK